MIILTEKILILSPKTQDSFLGMKFNFYPRMLLLVMKF